MPKMRWCFSLQLLGVIALAACGGTASDATSTDVQPRVSMDRAASLSAACSGCHSDQSGAIASLQAYSPDALSDTLLRYKSEVDETSVMHRLARGYTDDDFRLIADFLGTREEAQ